jgi:hypothetical protein
VALCSQRAHEREMDHDARMVKTLDALYDDLGLGAP